MDSKIELCARAAHEMNRIYCIAIGDHSQPHWEDAPAWQQSSAIHGVMGVLEGSTPERSHASWMQEKIDTGWKYGPVKDPEKKEHPCMVPYEKLPPEQKRKDVLYLATVRMMASTLAEIVGDRA